MKGISMVCLALLILAGCRQETHDAATDIVGYAEQEDNGLRKRVQVGQWEYTIQYKPAEYILQNEQAEDTTGLAARRAQLTGMAWFNISFRVQDFPQTPLRYEVSGPEEYNARLHYFLNDAPRDIYLLYGEDTLRVAGYGFDNNHNLTPHETMVAGFALPGDERPVRDMQLAFYDRVFRNGIIKATIRAKHLSSIPSFGNPVQIN